MTIPPGTRVAAIYARVSTEDQVKGFSIPTQLEACRKLADHDGYTVPETHVLVDEGISGSTMDRPGLRTLRALVNTQAIAAAIVYDPDRLSRNLGHQLLLAEEFERVEVKLLIVSHPLEQGPEGWLFFQMRGALAEYERAKILERTRRGLLGRAKAGHTYGASVPLGYRYLSEPHGGHFEIDEEEAALVRRIFEMCLAGHSSWTIARQLTEEHIPTKWDRSPGTRRVKSRKQRGEWNHLTVYAILTNEAYIGRVFWNKRQRVSKTRTVYRPREEWIEIAIPPILPEEVFHAAQGQLKRNKVLSKRNRKYEYLLVGRRLRCGRCGRTMSGGFNKGHRRYRCNSFGNTPAVSLPCRGSLRADVVEGQVWTAIERVLEQPEWVAAEVKKQSGYLGAVRIEAEREMELLKGALGKCEREEQRWAKAYAAEVIDIEELKQYRAEIEQRRHSLRERHAEVEGVLASAARTEHHVGDLTTYCARVRAGLRTLDWDEKRRVLEALDIVVTYRPNEPFHVRGSIPLESDAIVSSTAECTLHRGARACTPGP